MNETKFTPKIGDVTSSAEKNSSAQGDGSEPWHRPHAWHLPELRNNYDAVFASTVIDVARGVGVIVSILGEHLTDLNVRASGGGDSVRTLLSESDTEALVRLAAFSLEELYGRAEGRVEALNATVAAGAQA